MKLALAAMSGVRAENAALMEAGLTLPGFVERSRIIAGLPSLGLLTLAGLTPDRVETAYVEVPDLPPAPWTPVEADLVAISSYSAQIKQAYALADRYRARGTKVVLGGLHVTAMAEEAQAHADAVVLGEGEPVWTRLVRDFEAGRLQAVYDARGQTYSLADSPMPRYDLLEPDRYNRLTVQTQRGCPFDCEFCAASIRLSPGFRTKPLGRVTAEIDEIRRIWPRPFVELADDNSFADRKRGLRLAETMGRADVRWFTETDLSVAYDEDLLDALEQSGCQQVLIGFESPQPGALDSLERRSNWKHRQWARYLEAVDRIQSRGISVNGCFILGLDGSGPQSFGEVLRFIRESELSEVQITVLTPFPGTPLYRRLASEGRLLQPTAWERCTLFDVNFRPTGLSAEELESGFLNLAKQVYSDEETSRRKATFLPLMRRRFERRKAF